MFTGQFTGQYFVRISTTDSADVTHSEEFPLDPDEKYLDVFKLAHSEPNGALPKFAPPGTRESAYAWNQAVALRALEDRLIAKCNVK